MTSSDYTAIELRYDPIVQRLSGTTRIGDIPFDVPFMSQITNKLWVGGCQKGLILPDHIDHLISLYPWERYRIHHDIQSELYVRMHDDDKGGFNGEQVKSLARWVNVCQSTGTTLVHCQAGLNRSSLVAGTALVYEGGWKPDRVISRLREARSPAVLCNSLFEEWLFDRTYEDD